MTQHSLTLREIRLEPGGVWVVPGGELTFCLPRCGHGVCVCGASTEPLGKGDVVVIAHPTDARLMAASDKCLEVSWFSIRPEHLYPLFGSSEIVLLHSFLEGFRGLRRYPDGSSETQECHAVVGHVPSACNLDHRSRLLRVAATILSAEFDRVRCQNGTLIPNDTHFSRVIESLSIDDLQGLGIDDLAVRFGCSRRHLNRLFQKHFGVSVADLRREARLLKALCLLRRPQSKIMAVAEECGFNHLGLFNATFRKRFGASPGEVRKEWARLDDGGEEDGAAAGAGTATPVREMWAFQRLASGHHASREHAAPERRREAKPASALAQHGNGAGTTGHPARRAAEDWLDLRARELLASNPCRPEVARRKGWKG